MNEPDFTTVTEQWGMPVPQRQLAMIRCRYDLAAEHARGRDVLEIGCGTGVGIDFLRKTARRVIGGDFSEDNLRAARTHVPSVPVVALDAHALPCRTESLDTILLLEVIYYLANPLDALRECRRVLRRDGVIVVCLPNPAGRSFHASPFSHDYPDATRLAALLDSAGFDAQIYGGFKAQDSAVDRLVAAGTDLASRVGLMPRTLRGRSRLKRLVHGKLKPLESLGSEAVHYPALDSIAPDADDAKSFTNLYAVGHRR